MVTNKNEAQPWPKLVLAWGVTPWSDSMAPYKCSLSRGFVAGRSTVLVAWQPAWSQLVPAQRVARQSGGIWMWRVWSGGEGT